MNSLSLVGLLLFGSLAWSAAVQSTPSIVMAEPMEASAGTSLDVLYSVVSPTQSSESDAEDMSEEVER